MFTTARRNGSVSAYLLLSVMLTGAGVYGSIPLLLAETSSRWEAVSSIAVLLTVFANIAYQYFAKRDTDRKAEEAKAERVRVAAEVEATAEVKAAEIKAELYRTSTSIAKEVEATKVKAAATSEAVKVADEKNVAISERIEAVLKDMQVKNGQNGDLDKMAEQIAKNVLAQSREVAAELVSGMNEFMAKRAIASAQRKGLVK